MRFAGIVLAVAVVAPLATARAQDAVNLQALGLLAPFSALLNSPRGRAALAADFTVTAEIQNGAAGAPGLASFSRQQAQALKDATITAGNGWELADGLGTRLGRAYQSLARFGKPPPGQSAPISSDISPAQAGLFAYSAALAGADSAAAKYFFANATLAGKGAGRPVSAAALAIMARLDGTTDVFGKAYHEPAGGRGADPLGDSRPFQTEPRVTYYTDPDFYGDPAGNRDYLTGPAQNLTASPSFPSGHTTYGFTESLLFAVMVPERFTQMVTRGAEYGNNRIVLGAHYAMDVIGGRSLAIYDLAHLLANDPAYLDRKMPKTRPVADFRAKLAAAKADLRAALAKRCGTGIAACAADSSRFADAARNEAFVEATQTYGLPVVHPATAGGTEDVYRLAPQAGYLLTTAFPSLSLRQADDLLTATESPGGGFLDDGSPFGVYSRLDLYKAGQQAASYK